MENPLDTLKIQHVPTDSWNIEFEKVGTKTLLRIRVGEDVATIDHEEAKKFSVRLWSLACDAERRTYWDTHIAEKRAGKKK